MLGSHWENNVEQPIVIRDRPPSVGRARGYRNLVTIATSYVSGEIAASNPRQTRPNHDGKLSKHGRRRTTVFGVIVIRNLLQPLFRLRKFENRSWPSR
jgi:hypothetical protein